MLTIRMQRTGRKGHAMFRVVVQDSRQAPSSGKVVARLGSYDPHAKTLVIDKEKAAFYMEHGAQPSDRAAYLLKNEGVKLPAWVKDPAKRERAVRNPDKRRSTAPAEPAAEPAAESEPAAEAEAAEAEPAKEAEAPVEADEAANEEAAAEEPEKSEENTESTSDDSAEKPA